MATETTVSNHDRIGQGLRIVQGALGPFIHRELSAKFGGKWWTEGVLLVVSDQQRRELPQTGREKEMVQQLDIAALLNLMNRRWPDVFAPKLPRDARNYVNGLLSDRADSAPHT